MNYLMYLIDYYGDLAGWWLIGFIIVIVSTVILFHASKNAPFMEECDYCGYPEKPKRVHRIEHTGIICGWCFAKIPLYPPVEV